MSRKEEYVKVERERIAEKLESITDLKLLGFIYRIASNFADDTSKKKGGAV